MASGANTVVVNQLFVERMLGGRNAIGRRLRYKVRDARGGTNPGPWFEIVGVVRDLVSVPAAPLRLDNPARPLVYHTLGSSPSQSYPLYLAAHVKGDPLSVLPALRRIAADVSPTLRLDDVQRLDRATATDVRGWNAISNTILLISTIALLLSLAGIYAVTSFTVSRRTREIAIRVALGARVSHVVANVFRGPLGQAASGVAVGCAMVGGLIALFLRNADVTIAMAMRQAALLLLLGTSMMAVCALACIGPLLRVFRVQPTDVLRDDG
jgi:putative ABC transport system permease protein